MPTEQLTFATLAPVTLDTRWGELLGEGSDAMPAGERRKRWEAWKALCGRRHADMLAYWTENGETCDGCRHRDGDWCGLMELPTNVNPVLTIRHGTIGMACMGAGYETVDGKPRPPADPEFVGPLEIPF